MIYQDIFNSDTVFVLGAGASKPYNFPLGSELKQEIISNSNTNAILNSVGFENDLIKGFREALRYSYHPTLDIFLEKKSVYREIGSYFITLALLPHENPDFLFPQRDWYGELFKILDFENEAAEQSCPSFVTLNYDRSLEHFLNMNIEYNCQDKKLDLCHTRRKNIRIVHAHGSFGDYASMPYGMNAYDPEVLKKVAGNIKIISDRLDDSPDFQEAQRLISQAGVVVFFGFGYDETTIDALIGTGDWKSKLMFGTNLGLDNDKITSLNNKFEGALNLGGQLNCKHLIAEIGKVKKQEQTA